MKRKRLALERRTEHRKALSSASVETTKSSASDAPPSPNSSFHNLTVTYHYVQSPITSSTRSLSELSSVLPSDGVPLKSQNQPNVLSTSPSRQHPLSCSPSYRRARKRLKIDSGSQNADVQRLLNIASQLCTANHSSREPNATPPRQPLTYPQQVNHNPNASPLSYTDAQSEIKQEKRLPLHDGDSDDSDEAFWSQAAQALEGNDWEDKDKEVDGDSAFIDELISSGLVRTPQISLQGQRSSPRKHHVMSPHQSSLPPTTPLSHLSHKLHLHRTRDRDDLLQAHE